MTSRSLRKRITEWWDDVGDVHVVAFFFAGIASVFICAAIVSSIAFLILLTGLSMVILWPFIATQVWPFLFQQQTDDTARAAMAAVLLLLSLILYLIRRYFRALYGVGEVLIGIGVCWQVLGAANEDTISRSLASAAAVYLMVRGIDNVVEARKTSPLLARIIEYIWALWSWLGIFWPARRRRK